MEESYEAIVKCIQKPSKERLESEISAILPWFLNKAGQVFGKLKPEISKDIIKNCQHTVQPRDGIVIRQGDKGDCFYVLLNGRVSIYINTEAVPDDPAEAQILSTDNDSEEKKELDRTKYGKYIVSFDSGKSFGEIALLNADCVRNASIIADEFCHLVVINRDLYNRSIRSVQEAEQKEKQDFINNCDLFSNWMARYKRQAVMSLRKETFKFEQHIVKQGEPLDGLYFLLNGQAKVVIDIIQHTSQYPQLHLNDNLEELHQKEVIGKLVDQNTEDKTDIQKQKLWDKPLRRQGYVAAEQRQSQRHIEVSLVGPGELIGDVEHGMDLSTYAQSIICVQNTDVFILDAKNFERLVMNKKNSSTSMELLAMKAETKLMTRVTRALDKQIPLIRSLCKRILDAHYAEQKRKEKVDKDSQYLSELRNADTAAFIPLRGPLIDPYGPGTVFYRNKLKRERQKATSRTFLQMQQQQAPAIIIPTLGMLEAKEENSEKSDRSSDDASIFTKKKVIEEFQDFETSSEHLTDLEKRMRRWFQEVEKTKKAGNYQSEVVRMNRFKREINQKIHPGKKVFMRPKQTYTEFSIENEDTGYKSEDEEVFITARSEIRSRLSSRRQHSAFAPSAYSHNSAYYNDGDDTDTSISRKNLRLRPSSAPNSSHQNQNRSKTRKNSLEHSSSHFGVLPPITVHASPPTTTLFGQITTDLHENHQEKKKKRNGKSKRKKRNPKAKKKYTMEEYLELKAQLKRKEIQLESFKLTLIIR